MRFTKSLYSELQIMQDGKVIIECATNELRDKVSWLLSYENVFRNASSLVRKLKKENDQLKDKIVALISENELFKESNFTKELIENGFLFNADPKCKHDLQPWDGEWRGVKCSKCGGWFCY